MHRYDESFNQTYWSIFVFKVAVFRRIWISLALEVLDDFLFEMLHVFRVDISTTDQFVTWNGSPFVEFHISISSDGFVQLSEN